MRAARSTASSSVAGWPSTKATGRSSTWWLRNQALPSTQAFLALVMWLSSTVSSISSQTQPQKVQVALETTLSSVISSFLSATSLLLLLKFRDGDVFSPGLFSCRASTPAASVRQEACAGCRTSSTSKVWGYGHGCRSSVPSWGDPRAAAACGLAPWPTATASAVSLVPASRRLLVSSLLQF